MAPVRSYLDAHSILPLSAALVNVIFLCLLLLLWLAYRRWAGSVLYAVDLDRVFASISPDVLLVVAPDRRIIMCNESARTMFGYSGLPRLPL